jgi:hypothetical protein
VMDAGPTMIAQKIEKALREATPAAE